MVFYKYQNCRYKCDVMIRNFNFMSVGSNWYNGFKNEIVLGSLLANTKSQEE